MKLFTKIALITAMAASGSAFALQSMDDAALADTTGQDGITMLVGLPQVAGSGVLSIQQIALFDGNGFTGSTTAGALTFGQVVAGTGTGFSITDNGAISVVIDSSGGTGGTKPILNIAVNLPSVFNVVTGDINVTGATGSAGAYAVNATGASKIMNSVTIGLGNASLNIQLGNPTQGALAVVSGTVTGGLTIAGFGITDNTAGMGGTLGTTNISLKSNGSADLNLKANVDMVTTAGLNGIAGLGTTNTAGALLLTLGNGTANSANYDVYVQGVTLGDAASTLGDVKITGMNLTGAKVAISGH